jgi:hypothetical protein
MKKSLERTQATAGFLSKFLKYNNMAANRNNFLTFFFSERRNLLGALLFIWLFHFVFNFELWFADKNRLFPMLPAALRILHYRIGFGIFLC